MDRAYADTLLRWRWPVIVATLLVVAAFASGGRFLGFTTDYRAFFSADNPQLKAFEELQDTYDRADSVVFIVTPGGGNVFDRDVLSDIQWLTKQAWKIPYALRVDSVTNYQHTSVMGDELSVADLIGDTGELDVGDLAEAKRTALAEPSLINRIVNPDASVTAVNVTIHLPGESMTEVPEVAAYARSLAADFEARNPDVAVGLTGMIMFNNAFGENARSDASSLIPLMFAVVIVGLGILFRSVSATFATTIMLFLSIMVGMGVFGWSGLKLTPPSVSAPNIIMTLAVADAVHFLFTFLSAMRNGSQKYDAIKESLRVNMQPIFLTSLTTAIGFFALNASDTPPIVHLGNIVGVGVIAAFVLSVTFLPALMAVLPVRVKPMPDQQSRLIGAISKFVTGNHKAILGVSTLVALLFVAMIPMNKINDDYVSYFDQSTSFRVDTDYAIKHLIGPNNIQYSLKSSTPDGITDPAFLSSVLRFVDYLQTQSEVKHVFSITDTMKRLNKTMHADGPSWYRLPESKELAAQYLLLYELSLPFGLDLNNQVNIDKSSTRVGVSFNSMTTGQMLALEDRFGNWLRTNAPNLAFEASSSNLMFSHIGQRNTRSMIGGAVIALAIISIILIVALRSVKIGLISLIPNLVPIGIAFGIWGLVVGEVGLSLAPVVGMALGVVVDDTIHFLSKYLRARREQQLGANQAIQFAFKHVGPALMITTSVLVAGFLILTLSPFKLNSDMGLLTALAIATALAVDFLLLPSLLIEFDRKGVPDNG